MQLEELWQGALAELELQISRPNFLTWLKNSRLIGNDGGEVVVALPNNFSKEWVESKYHKLILETLRSRESVIRKVTYIVESGVLKRPEARETQQEANLKQFALAEFKTDPESGLNPRYTLNSFVVGSSNELAYAAAQAIIENVGKKYNPFFIHGGVGLGKTHLIQAIGNEIKRSSGGALHIRYVPSEKFTNEVIWALRNKRIEDIKQRYRNIDVLIIDDIQFIGGKQRTEEEFFHTFNALHENNKQIIISSDRPPRSLPVLEERLRSRFEGGMIADIGLPDYETRVAIVKVKLQERNEPLPEDVVHLIAKKLQGNVRLIEGTLNKLVFSYIRAPHAFSASLAEKLINETIEQATVNISPTQIIKAVATFYEIQPNDLVGRGRKKEIVEPRQIAIYLLRNMLNLSYPYIAEKIGKRDHTTAIYAFEKIDQLLPKNPNLNQKVAMIKELIQKGDE